MHRRGKPPRAYVKPWWLEESISKMTSRAVFGHSRTVSSKAAKETQCKEGHQYGSGRRGPCPLVVNLDERKTCITELVMSAEPMKEFFATALTSSGIDHGVYIYYGSHTSASKRKCD